MNNAVFIIDDDAAVRDSLSLLLGLRGYRTMLFSSAESFLSSCRDDWRGCILLDLRMNSMDGLTLQQTLRERSVQLPVIIITGHGDVRSAREAFRLFAVDFLEKPIDERHLVEAIEEAFAQQSTDLKNLQQKNDYLNRLATLTPREREVLHLVTAGQHNREIAELLRISGRTVEVHKRRVMSKLGATSIPQLMRMSLGASTQPHEP